jgi:hypothetical protein
VGPCPKTINVVRNVTVKPVVTIQATSGSTWVTLRTNSTLSGNVSLGINGALPSTASRVMSGTQTTTYAPIFIYGTQKVQLSYAVKITGTVRLTNCFGVVTVSGYGPVSGSATITILSGSSARFIVQEYLPVVSKADVYWSDDFSSDKGWVNWTPDVCDIELVDDTLQVTVNTTLERCYVAPPPEVQLKEGNFSVKARRRNSELTWYGLIFNASTALLQQHWALEVRPSGGDPCASNSGLIWLSYVTEGPGQGDTDLWDLCSTSVLLDTNDWNTLNAVRHGDSVQVFINGSHKSDLDQNNGTLSDEPFFDLEVMSSDTEPVVVQFDDFTLRY